MEIGVQALCEQRELKFAATGLWLDSWAGGQVQTEQGGSLPMNLGPDWLKPELPT